MFISLITHARTHTHTHTQGHAAGYRQAIGIRPGVECEICGELVAQSLSCNAVYLSVLNCLFLAACTRLLVSSGAYPLRRKCTLAVIFKNETKKKKKCTEKAAYYSKSLLVVMSVVLGSRVGK